MKLFCVLAVFCAFVNASPYKRDNDLQLLTEKAAVMKNILERGFKDEQQGLNWSNKDFLFSEKKFILQFVPVESIVS